MKNYITTIKYFLTFVFIVAFVFFGRGAPKVEANTIASQINSSDLSNGGSTTFFVYQFLGTGFNSVPKTIEVYAKVSTGTVVYTLAMTQCDDSTYNSGCVNFGTWSQLTMTGNTKTLYTSTNSDNDQMNPSKYYYFATGVNTGSPLPIFYGTTNANDYNADPLACFSACGINHLYFVISDDEPSTVDPTTNYITIFSPTNNQIIGSPYRVTFTTLYNYISTYSYIYDTLRFSIIDNNTGGGYDIPDVTLTDPIRSSISQEITLAKNHTFTFQAYFFNSSDNTIPRLYSSTIVFNTDSNGTVDFIDPTTGELVCDITHIMNCVKNAGIWLFIPSNASIQQFKTLTLADSIPFSYIYDVGNLYNDAFDHAPEDISITIPFGSSTLSLLSTTQLEAVPFQSLVRDIMGAIMIFFSAMFLYKKIIRIHDSGNKSV